MQSQELELRAYGYVPVAQHEADTVLSNIYSEARGNANEEGSEPPVPHIGQVILKTVAGCNFACKTDTPGFGYECYEYVTDEWKDMPPVMDDEVAWQTGIAIGTYAARNSLRSVEGIIHGGEPLFVPNDPSRPGQKAAQYYDRQEGRNPQDRSSSHFCQEGRVQEGGCQAQHAFLQLIPGVGTTQPEPKGSRRTKTDRRVLSRYKATIRESKPHHYSGNYPQIWPGFAELATI